MTKQAYKYLLTTPKWIKKREIILKRDRHRCQKCLSRDDLQVHHIWYIEGKMPWEVPNEYLITLCRKCHEKEHKGKPISAFIKKVKIRKKPKTSIPIKGATKKKRVKKQ